MNFHDIAGFLAIVRAVDAGENLTEAADDSNLSQSALPRRLPRLEHDQCTSLFERHGRKLVPNTRRQAFLPHAKAMIDERTQSVDNVTRLMDAERGRVRLDFMHS